MYPPTMWPPPEAADLILIGLKPVTVPEVVRQIRPALTPQKL